MTTTLTTAPRKPGSAPSISSRDFADLLATMGNGLEQEAGPHDLVIHETKAPTEDERRMLEDRRSELLDALDGRSQDREANRAKLDAIVMLNSPFSTFGQTTEDLRAVSKVHLLALDDVPVWAVQIAVRAFIKGLNTEKWNRRESVSPTTLGMEARRHIVQTRTELNKIEAVLNARVVEYVTSPEQREKNLKAFNDLLAELRGTGKLEVSEERARHAAGIAEANRRAIERDAATRESLGLPPREHPTLNRTGGAY